MENKVRIMVNSKLSIIRVGKFYKNLLNVLSKLKISTKESKIEIAEINKRYSLLITNILFITNIVVLGFILFDFVTLRKYDPIILSNIISIKLILLVKLVYKYTKEKLIAIFCYTGVLFNLLITIRYVLGDSLEIYYIALNVLASLVFYIEPKKLININLILFLLYLINIKIINNIYNTQVICQMLLAYSVCITLSIKRYKDKELEITKRENLIEENLRLLEKNKELELEANEDKLTGIRNRQSMDKYLNEEWEKCKKNGTNIGLLMIDIDYFKNYNDKYGHLEGDNCLRKVANILKNNVRRENEKVFRYGGEEFIVVVTDTSLLYIEKLAETIRKSVENENIDHCKSKISKYLTLSIGGYLIEPKEEYNINDLINKADILLYKSKENGRNKTTIDSEIIEIENKLA